MFSSLMDERRRVQGGATIRTFCHFFVQKLMVLARFFEPPR
jgi:hypothetical protein